jgi:hypothetical protein
MIPEPLTFLANHLWQSTLFAGAAGLLTLLLRKNRAAIRHSLWLTASLKFLVPFSLLIAIGNRMEWPADSVEAPTVIVSAVEGFGYRFTPEPQEVTTGVAGRTKSQGVARNQFWASLFLIWLFGGGVRRIPLASGVASHAHFARVGIACGLERPDARSDNALSG